MGYECVLGNAFSDNAMVWELAMKVFLCLLMQTMIVFAGSGEQLQRTVLNLSIFGKKINLVAKSTIMVFERSEFSNQVLCNYYEWNSGAGNRMC